MSDYMTTKELADYLRIKERKVYDLVSSNSVPYTKATGKLLFSRETINNWLEQRGNDLSASFKDRPKVFLGSHDPLLEWAIRESNCGIATWFDGSSHGLELFASRDGIATGLHIYDDAQNTWNTTAVRQTCSNTSAVLIEWAKRSRGLIFDSSRFPKITKLSDLKGLKIASRQPEAGAHDTLVKLLHQNNIKVDTLTFSYPYRTENDSAVAVLTGEADVTFGLKALANQYGLYYAPIIEERFDLLVDRKSWFDPSFQKLMTFTRDPIFLTKSSELTGYDISDLGKVRQNL